MTNTPEDHQQEFYKLLMQVQHETPSIKKISEGQIGHQKYKYAPIEEVQKVLHPVLQKYGIGYIQHINPDIHNYIATTIYTQYHQEIFFFALNEYTNDPKDMGKVLTYAKRYALIAHFGLIIEGEDDDGDIKKQNKTNNTKTEKSDTIWLSQEQFEKTMQADAQGIQAVIDTYNGQETNGKKYGMKKLYKEQLEKKLQEFI